MGLKSVLFKNLGEFKEDVHVDFNNVTSFVGTNGSGKSTMLEGIFVALDFLGRGEVSARTEAKLECEGWKGATVTFRSETPSDCANLVETLSKLTDTPPIFSERDLEFCIVLSRRGTTIQYLSLSFSNIEILFQNPLDTYRSHLNDRVRQLTAQQEERTSQLRKLKRDLSVVPYPANSDRRKQESEKQSIEGVCRQVGETLDGLKNEIRKYPILLSENGREKKTCKESVDKLLSQIVPLVPRVHLVRPRDEPTESLESIIKRAADSKAAKDTTFYDQTVDRLSLLNAPSSEASSLMS